MAAKDNRRGTKRYTNLTLFRKGNARDEVLPWGAALREGATYVLEVAVRYIPSRIPTLTAQQGIVEPGQKRPVKIMVVLEGSKFWIASTGTSADPAAYRGVDHDRQIRSEAAGAIQSAADVAEIRVRLYYEFNLLDVMILRAEVVGKFDDQEISRFGTSRR